MAFYVRLTRFQTMHCDPETDTIVFKSIRGRSNVLLSLIALHFPPLQFCCHFEVTRSIFGTNIVDANVSQRLVIVMHSDQNVRMYSFEFIMKEVIL